MRRMLLLPLCAASLSLLGCQNDGDRTSWFGDDDDDRTMASGSSDVESLTRGWPRVSRDAAQKVAAKYGAPDESTPTMLVWHDTGPWEKTAVYKEEVEHNFPMPHKDVLEQWIAYEAPPEVFDELAMYDGSVIVERTKGVMSARCDKEEANFLAINLAHDVATGRRSVEDARAYYARAIRDFMQNNRLDPYMEGLEFDTMAAAQAGDPDQRASVLAGVDRDR